MMMTLFASLALAAATSLYDAKLVVQLDFPDVTVENRAQRLADIRASGADALEIAVAEFFPDGERRARELAKLRDTIAYFERAGYPVAVWTSSLGYGESTNRDLLRRFPKRRKLRSFGGEECVVCSTDVDYAAALADNAKDFIRAGAKFILWDDDLVQACRPGVSCVCDEHLRRCSRRVGRAVTAAEVRDSFTGAPNAVRTAFLDVMGESLQDLCHALRRAADEVDPTVGMGVCASYTHYDLDGVRMDRLVRSLMAKGQPRPFLRVSGAPYWAAGCWKPEWRKTAGLDLGGVIEFVRTQTARYRDTDFLLTDENDPYPRKSDKVPAGMCEVYDKAMIAEGGIVRNKYILRYGAKRADTAYLSAHLANRPGDAALADLFRDTRPVGFRVYHPERLLRVATLPTEFVGEKQLKAFASFPMAGLFLAQNGVPTQYERDDQPGAAFGPAAAAVPQAAFVRGLLTDLSGARALRAAGVDVGIAEDGADGVALTPSAEVLSWTWRGLSRVPEWWLYADAAGGKFAVLNHDQRDLEYGEGTIGGFRDRCWRTLTFATKPVEVEDAPLDRIWRFFTGGGLPVRVIDARGVYALAKERADGTLVSLVCNVRGEPTGEFEVELRGKRRTLALPPWGFTTVKE